MGNCNSSGIINRDAKVSTRVCKRNPLIQCCYRCFSCCKRRHFYITNNSDNHASFMISPGPISDLSELTINKLGKISINKRGNDKTQKFKVLAQKQKSIRIHSNYIYVTAFLLINNKWKQLWGNREITCIDDLTVWNYHVQEANIDEVFYDEDDNVDE